MCVCIKPCTDPDSTMHPFPLPCFRLLSGDQKPDRACRSSVAPGAAYKEVKLASALESFYREVHYSKYLLDMGPFG